MLKKIELKEISIKIERVNDDEKESEAVHEPLVLAPVSPSPGIVLFLTMQNFSALIISVRRRPNVDFKR